MADLTVIEPPHLTLTTKVAALRDPSVYPEHPLSVELMDTHMSCVFLTDTFAYKLKKPVRYEFLDFSTLELRRISCEEELKLNRRLAPDIYLDVVPLTIGADGRLAIGGHGSTIDWLVKMRRLPAHRMLDAAIKTRTLTEDDIEHVADLLARFYASSQRFAIDPSVYRRRFEQEIELSKRELPAHGVPDSEIAGLVDSQARFLRNEPLLLERRASHNRIVEGHGDLRPEHVYLGPPPRIIDCLEFSRDLRLIDPVDEICFLTMECELLGEAVIGERVLAAYRTATSDDVPASLVSFYKSVRALLRARLAIWHLRDPVVDNPAKWLARARDYVRVASRHAEAIERAASVGYQSQ